MAVKIISCLIQTIFTKRIHTYPSIADHTPCFESTRCATLCLSTGQTRIDRVVSKVLWKNEKKKEV